MTIKTKLLGALSFILITAFVATSLINYMVTRDSVREELLNSSLPLTGKNIYSEIHAAMMRPILVSSSMANDAFLIDWVLEGEKSKNEIIKYLSGIKDKYGFTTVFFVSHTTDRYYYQNGILKEISPRAPHDVWYYAFVRTGEEYDLDVDTNEAEDNTLTIFVNYRVEDEEGRFLGVAGVGVNMNRATMLLESARRTYKRDVYLVDRDGLVQVHPDRRRIERFDISKAGGIRELAPQILTLKEEPTSLEYDWDGKHTLLSTRYIPELGWHLIVEQDEKGALTAARHNLIRTLAVGFGASLLIIVLCVATINHFQARLERMAKTDPLTGVANRRALEERFELAAYKADRYGDTFSILIIDLDGFKAINDRQGHLAGDAVLQAVASIITATIRPADLLARWGGDEFIVLMDGKKEDARGLVARLRTAMSTSAQENVVTFSCGIAEFEVGDDIGSLTHRADSAMYDAKAKGGDRVEAG